MGELGSQVDVTETVESDEATTALSSEVMEAAGCIAVGESGSYKPHVSHSPSGFAKGQPPRYVPQEPIYTD